jgi:molybdate transport system substrate-binding protein
MWRLRVVLAVALAVTLAGCGGDDDDDDSAATSASGSLSGSVNVFAASSLTDAYTELAERFESAYPGTSVVNGLNFAASSDLVTQITEGAPADVFASADESNMTKIEDAGANKGDPVDFARNRLEIAVEPGNPKGIVTLDDLARADVSVVLCAETVPCGRLADEMLQQAGVAVTPVSREANVRDALGKVGEADAAIVYTTDVRASHGAVDGVAIPDDQNVLTTLPIVVLTDSENASLAEAWVEYVTSPEAQSILTDEFGFLAP